MVLAECQELVSVFRHPLVPHRSRLGWEVELREAALYVGGVVRADEDPLAAEFPQSAQARVDRDDLGRRGRRARQGHGRW